MAEEERRVHTPSPHDHDPQHHRAGVRRRRAVLTARQRVLMVRLAQATATLQDRLFATAQLLDTAARVAGSGPHPQHRREEA